MKQSQVIKYPNSANLFQFCRQVLDDRFGGVRVIDQDVGQILGFDPADCSHWKKGKKNVRSIQAMKSIANHLNIDEKLVVDVALGELGAIEAFIEYKGYGQLELDASLIESSKKEFYRGKTEKISKSAETLFKDSTATNEAKIIELVNAIHKQINFKEAPLYLPELFAAFPGVRVVACDDASKFKDLSVPIRWEQKNEGLTLEYLNHDETKGYLRFNIAAALAHFFLDGDEFDAKNDDSSLGQHLWTMQSRIFAAHLLTPSEMIRHEMGQLDLNKDVISQLAETFWVSKTFMNQRIRHLLNA